MLSNLLSRVWWLAAGQRAARSFLVGFVPFVVGIVSGNTTVLLAGISTSGLLAILSLVTSLRDLPESNGLPRPWWAAALDRVTKTFAQALIANIPAVTLIQDVPWTALLTNAAAAAAGSLILAVISILPETQPSDLTT